METADAKENTLQIHMACNIEYSMKFNDQVLLSNGASSISLLAFSAPDWKLVTCSLGLEVISFDVLYDLFLSSVAGGCGFKTSCLER